MKSGYSGLWLILSLSLIIILIIAFSDELSIGRWTIKQAPYKEALLSSKKIDFEEQHSLSDSTEEVKDKNNKHEVDSLPQSILLIGDSMTLNLAYRLSQYASVSGHEFHAINWDSSNTKIWAQSDTLDYFIKEYDATFVFVSLGSNELYLMHPEGHRKYVETILEKIGDLPYVWIGPPNWKEDAGINDMIESACKKGSFFRSAGMTFERKKDKVHPTRAASALWIDSIVRWLPKSSHPIILEIPSDSIGRISPNVTFLKAYNK